MRRARVSAGERAQLRLADLVHERIGVAMHELPLGSGATEDQRQAQRQVRLAERVQVDRHRPGLGRAAHPAEREGELAGAARGAVEVHEEGLVIHIVAETLIGGLTRALEPDGARRIRDMEGLR